MSTITVASLIQRVKQKVNEATNTDIGAVHTGVGGADDLTSDAGIALALNNSKNARCKQVFALYGTFTATWHTLQYWSALDGTGGSPAFAPQTSAPNNNPSTESGAILWWPRLLYWVSTPASGPVVTTPLTFCDESPLRLYDASYQITQTAAGASPTNFYRRAAEGVGVYPVPLFAAGQSVVVNAEGYFVPPDMTTGGNIDWCDPSKSQLLVVDAALEMIEKNFTDAQMGARLGEVKEEQAQLSAAYWLDLSPALRQIGAPFYAPDLAAMVARGGGGAVAVAMR